MTCAESTVSLGVYLVGALDADERAEVEAHLRDCADCRAELAELASLPSMLEQLSIEDFPLEPFPVPDDLFDRVAASAREDDERRKRAAHSRYRRLTAVAAAVVVIAVGGVGSVVAFHHGGNTAYSHQQGAVTMRVALASQASGTGLRVTVSGLPPNEHCWLIAVSKSGERDIAGRWDATYPGTAQETGSTKIPKSELSQLVLVGTGGKHLVTVDV
jgi:predicted anti-sigma-YlaC factor YlaD